MTMFGNKKIPTLKSWIVSDSVPMNSDDAKESFIYSPKIDQSQLDEFKTTYKRKTDDQYLVDKQYDITFERKYVKDLVHAITEQIKKKYAKVPLLILPFRANSKDEELKNFLNMVFKNGMPVEEDSYKVTIKETDGQILMAALKFIWCRLPGKAIIGWKAYTTFVKLEDKAEFPNKAFLDYMPNCLSSGAHASIVYDFFDLIVALVLNSKDNLMTPKKLSKVCGLWAFNPVRNKNSKNKAPSFERGLYEWIPAGDAMYHLLLSFVKAMPPNGDITKLPKLFQILLKSSEYPPLPTSATLETSRQLQEIPMVTIRANNPSKNPAELLTRVSKTLKFQDPTLFYTREDYLLLKRLFKEKDQVIQKLSAEGARLLENLCLYDKDLISDGNNDARLKYKLVPGWSTDMTSRKIPETKQKVDDFFTAVIGRVTIDDYFIWTWLASLGIEETDMKKKTFGKSYIMEVELAEGFKKWVIIEEQDLEREGYDLELEIKQQKLRELEHKIKRAELEAKKIKQKEKKNNKENEKPKISGPPPLPKKDYAADDLLPPRSKSRKPPPTSISANNSPLPPGSSTFIQKHDVLNLTPPPRSAKRRESNSSTGSSVHTRETYRLKPDGKLEKEVIKSDDPIRISLPALDDDDTFLKFEALGISEADLQTMLMTGYNYEDIINGYANGTLPTDLLDGVNFDEYNNNIPTTSSETTQQEPSSVNGVYSQIKDRQPSPMRNGNGNGNDGSPRRSPQNSSPRSNYTYQNGRIPAGGMPSGGMPINQASPVRQQQSYPYYPSDQELMLNNPPQRYSRSPPRGNSPPRNSFPPNGSPNGSPISSPPRSSPTYYPSNGSPPRTSPPRSSPTYYPSGGSPPRTSPPRSSPRSSPTYYPSGGSPPRSSNSPYLHSPSPSPPRPVNYANGVNYQRSPQQHPQNQRLSYPVARQQRLTPPPQPQFQPQNQRYSANEEYQEQEPFLSPKSPATTTFSTNPPSSSLLFPPETPEHIPTPPAETPVTLSAVSLENDSESSIPNLPPPSQYSSRNESTSTVSNQTEYITARTSPVIDEIDVLESELRDCIDDLESSNTSTSDQYSQEKNGKVSTGSALRVRKEPEGYGVNGHANTSSAVMKESLTSGSSSNYPSPAGTSQFTGSIPSHMKNRSSPNLVSQNNIASPQMAPRRNVSMRYQRPPQPYYSQPHLQGQPTPPQYYTPQQQYPPQSRPYPQGPPSNNSYNSRTYPQFVPVQQQYPHHHYQSQPPPQQYPQGRYQQQPPQFYPPPRISANPPPMKAARNMGKGPGQFQQPPRNGYYPPNAPMQGPRNVGDNYVSNNVIQNLPPSTHVDKLHGPQHFNKKNARDAFMTGDFGI